MKLELDTINKTIGFNERVNIGELYDMFAELGLDVDEWVIYPLPQITTLQFPERNIWGGTDVLRYNQGTSNPYTINCNTTSESTSGNVTCTNVKAKYCTPTN